MDLGLQGKGVIVTGASKGIGRAIALEFAREGANVAICARGAEALEQTRADVAALGGKVFAAPWLCPCAAALKRRAPPRTACMAANALFCQNARTLQRAPRRATPAAG
jgi:3-oxoacyl-[acyl-carrier protein] reductase